MRFSGASGRHILEVAHEGEQRSHSSHITLKQHHSTYFLLYRSLASPSRPTLQSAGPAPPLARTNDLLLHSHCVHTQRHEANFVALCSLSIWMYAVLQMRAFAAAHYFFCQGLRRRRADRFGALQALHQEWALFGLTQLDRASVGGPDRIGKHGAQPATL